MTGAAGLIGSYLLQTAAQSGASCRVISLTRADLDLLDFDSVRERFRRQQPKLIVHCAALSQSPACQKEPELARRMNVETTRLLAELAEEAPFIFFSTDLVFDGRKGNYVESDSVNPLSVYAETKVEAEACVLKNPRHTVIRTSLNGGTSRTGNRGFNEQLRNAFASKRPVRLFVDEFRSPIPAIETARAVWNLATRGATGLLHVAGAERLSRWQIGELIAARWPQLHPELQPESLASYEGAPRSPDTSLDSSKAEALLGAPLPSLSHWLRQHPNERF